ncbi:zinc finger protein 346 [Engraulis encrasicolus]|uniref:zinc finger protein 346 n=1 Tax=Engraulis encrasicolus TaxID=184585 RepID=UPI002FD60F92
MAHEEANEYLPSGAAEVDRLIKENSDLFSDTQCKVCSAVLISDSQKLAHYQSKKHANKVRRYMFIHKEDSTLVKRLKTSTTESDTIDDLVDRTKACPVCNMTFHTPVIAESHYQGKVHAKNLKLKLANANTQTASPQAKTPQQTKPDAGPKQQPQAPAAVQGPVPEGTMTDRFCSLCNATFNNPLMAQQHYVGKKHQKQVAKPKASVPHATGDTAKPKTIVPHSTAPGLKGYPCKVCKIELNSQKQFEAHISGAKHKNQVKLMGGSQAQDGVAGDGEEYTPAREEFSGIGDDYVPVPLEEYSAMPPGIWNSQSEGGDEEWNGEEDVGLPFE